MPQLRNMIFKALRLSGLPFLLREIAQRNRVSIVMFHDPAPEAAERAFLFLKKKYNLIALDTFLEARRTGSLNSLPPKALVITLDDGHRRNRELLPMIQKHQIPVTIFLCSGVVDTRRHFWFLEQYPGMQKEALKQITNQKRLAGLAQAGFQHEREYEGPVQALTKVEIEEMKPAVNFQGHTVFHPCLHTCSDEEARMEIFHCKKTLEQTFGLPVNALAYPNGDYSLRDIELLKAAGYSCAITVDFGFNNLHTDPYRLKRLSIDDTDNTDAICVKASGLWTFLLGLFGKRKWNRLAPTLLQENTAPEAINFQTHESH
jgi:peptidoglycan/xylan/chitin deacetylase (PgdA/CDA1 family)